MPATTVADQGPTRAAMVAPQERVETLAATHALHHLPIGHPRVLVDVDGTDGLLAVVVHVAPELRAELRGAAVALEGGHAGIRAHAAQHIALRAAAVAPQNPHVDGLHHRVRPAEHEVLLVPEEHLHGLQGVATALRSTAAKQHVPGEYSSFYLGLIVVDLSCALQDPGADVRGEVVGVRLREPHAVHLEVLPLQVLHRLLQGGYSVLVVDHLQDPLHRYDHGLPLHHGNRLLVLFSVRRGLQLIVEILDAVVAVADLSGLLHQQNPALSLLIRPHRKNVTEV
mmetsp:Transcript_61276/g.164856  ORF Transcript_61276/g.164856 Transcript_61276/m.164856 type:complete len:283 (+) Transcript_61276:317-1165(+)